MGTVKSAEEKRQAAFKRRVRSAMRQAKGRPYTTSEILDKLDRGRTCFVTVMYEQLASGELDYVKYCLDRIREITELFERIETQRANADVETAKTIWAAPLILDRAENIDLEHYVGVDGGDA